MSRTKTKSQKRALKAPNRNGTGENRQSFQNWFHFLNESKRIQLQFASNRIKIGPLELEIQPAKGARRYYAWPMTSRDVIGLPPVTISLVTLYNCFLTVEDYTRDTQEISGTQLPYRRCERRIFLFFRKWNGYLKNKQGIAEVQISYQMQKTAMFCLQNCDLWTLFKNTKILSFSKKLKNYVTYKKNPMNKNLFCHILRVWNWALGSIIFFFVSKSIWSP